MTIREFERLGDQEWPQSLRIHMGLLSKKLYLALYKKAPKKARTNPSWRNRVNLYPCGILEQAYRELKGVGP